MAGYGGTKKALYACLNCIMLPPYNGKMKHPLDDIYIGYSDSMVLIARTIYAELLNQSDQQKQLMAKLTVAVMNRLSREIGGESYYITKTDANELTRRNWEMFGEFTGNNYRELSKRYGMSNAHVRKIVNACQRIRLSENKRFMLESSLAQTSP